MGAAQYSAGDWNAAIESLTKSSAMPTPNVMYKLRGKGGNSFDYFFLAMAHWQLGRKDEARHWYQLAAAAMNEYLPEELEFRHSILNYRGHYLPQLRSRRGKTARYRGGPSKSSGTAN